MSNCFNVGNTTYVAYGDDEIRTRLESIIEKQMENHQNREELIYEKKPVFAAIKKYISNNHNGRISRNSDESIEYYFDEVTTSESIVTVRVKTVAENFSFNIIRQE